ncbi:MAG: SidA/IucD/PvdA family monooxygenase, partial [Acinetobacter sp.]|nr:SidA/IucD/PvdA family monooxygenase [Acinetobacter sp.]
KLQQQVPEKCIHSADYLIHKKDKLKGNVVVLGSGQSSAEVFLDLFDQQYQHDCVPTVDFKLHWLTRSNGFFPMEYAPLGLEHFSPNYTQHFYRLSETQKAAQLKDQSLLYKGISAKTIREIYQKLYHRSIASATQATHLHAQIQLLNAELLESQHIRLSLEHTVTKQRFYMDVDFVVASTGYYSPEFSFLKYLKPLITTDQAGRWKVRQDYRLQHTAMGEIYVQNQEMHSHGVGTPDLGLGAFRAATIANQLLGYQLYELDSNEETFQHFNAEQNPEMYVQNDTSITRTAALAPSIPKSKNIEQRKIQTGAHPSMQPYTFEKII